MTLSYSVEPRDPWPPVYPGDVHLTLRRDRVKRHARLGEHFITHFPVDDVRRESVCVFRARILFAERGLVRMLAPVFSERGEPLWRLFTAAEQGSPQAAEHLEKIAHRDGFKTWPELVAWHARKGGVDDAGLIAREVIGYVTAEAG